VSPNGYLTLVETKLWKNPEARREVVAQIIDYTKQLVGWDYGKLEKAFLQHASGTGLEASSLHAHVCEVSEEEIDEAKFVDAVERCLKHGRFLLLIVGDGIHEGVEKMASYLQSTPSIQFTLGLVELGCYEVATDGEPSLLLIPHLVARTAEVERAIVRIEMTDETAKQLNVSTKTPSLTVTSTRRLSDQEFHGQLAEATSVEAANVTQEFMDELLAGHDLLRRGSTKGRLSINLALPDSDENPRMVLNVRVNGSVATTGYLLKFLADNGYGSDIGERYYKRLGEVEPHLAPVVNPDGTISVRIAQAPSIAALVPRLPVLKEAILQLARDVEEAAEEIEP